MIQLKGRARALPGLIVGLALILGPAGLAAAATYVVNNQDGACSNSGAGTPAQPYCTITAAANAHHAPGDTIVVKPGTYPERVSIPGSGAPGAPLVFRAQGPGVVVDGADSFANPTLWTAFSGAVWRASAVTWQPLQVFVDGVRVTPASVAPGALPANSFTWVSGEGLYVNLGGDNPGAHQTLVGRRPNGFYASERSWITIDGFEVAHAESRAVYLRTCTDMAIVRNRVNFSNSYGIEVVGGTRINVRENVVCDGNYHGIGLTSGSNGCVVRGNESFKNIDPAIRRANGIYVRDSYQNSIIGNQLHHNQDSGMFFTVGAINNVSISNRSWSNGDHGFDHVDAPGNIHSNDVAFGNYMDGFSVEGISPNVQIHNCIAVDNGLTTDEFDLWVNDSSSVGFVSDYNLFWNSTSQEPFKFITTTYGALTAYQAASGQDAHSFQADPRFENGPAGKFNLLAHSPAIDAGSSSVPGWPDSDAVGSPRVDECSISDLGTGPVTYSDIGALEVVQQLEPDVIMLPNPLNTISDGQPRHAKVMGSRASTTIVALSSGRPNPTHGAVEFALDLPGEARVHWQVFDLQGRSIWSEDRQLTAGRAYLRWDGSSTDGRPAPNGVYLVRTAVNDTVFNRRIIRF